VFLPGLTDLRGIETLVRRLEVPLNVLYAPGGPPVARLTGIGVRRVSLGSLLYRRALGAALEAAADVRAGRTPAGATPSYDDVAGLAAPAMRPAGDRRRSGSSRRPLASRLPCPDM
jgi:2-methylisocitrate lyase-like PEP mutase family enzyme